MATIIAGIADIKLAESPDEIVTSLGSCVGVCLYDKVEKKGGLLHFMMARSAKSIEGQAFKKAKFADTGIPELVEQLKKKYPQTKNFNLVAKIFGGAKLLKNVSEEIGKDNIVQTKEILAGLNIPVIAEKTGGDKGCRISFNLETGMVNLRLFGEEEISC